MRTNDYPIQPGQILSGPLFNEPMRVETAREAGVDTWVLGLVGLRSERFRSVTLTGDDIKSLTVLDSTASYTGEGKLLRLGLQAYSLGIAYEFDPYFGLSISRVDPLPHQLEAVPEDRRECYWLHAVNDCNTTPTLQEPVTNPARFDWHEVKKVDHCWLEVNALTKPMEIRDKPRDYGDDAQ